MKFFSVEEHPWISFSFTVAVKLLMINFDVTKQALKLAPVYLVRTGSPSPATVSTAPTTYIPIGRGIRESRKTQALDQESNNY